MSLCRVFQQIVGKKQACLGTLTPCAVLHGTGTVDGGVSVSCLGMGVVQCEAECRAPQPMQGSEWWIGQSGSESGRHAKQL